MEAHQQTPQMAMLAEVSSALRMESEAGSGTPYEIVDKALDRCATLSPVAAAAAFLVGRDGQLKLRGCRGWTPVSGIGTFFGGLDLLVRAIEQFDSSRRRLLTDLLASYEFVPGTVFHAGYGSLFEKRGTDDYMTTSRGLFFKASYLHRF